MALIDINTIISTFNERGTLLKWLQKLEAALAASTLETVTVNTTPNGAGAQFVFNFSDDTHIETPYITLPRGATGATGAAGKDGTNGADGADGKDGVGISEITEGEAYVAGDQTITPVTIHLTEGNPVDLNIKATNGAAAAAGKDGVGISEITEGEAYVAGDQTITPVTINLTEGDPVNLTVKAKNGTNGVDGTNGTNGTDGNGIVSVHALRHYTQGEEEITVVEVVTDDATNPQFEVHAQNGADAPINHLYWHSVTIEGSYNGISFVAHFAFPYPQEKLPEVGGTGLMTDIWNYLQDNYSFSTQLPATGSYGTGEYNAVLGVYAADNIVKLSLQSYGVIDVALTTSAREKVVQIF